MDVQPLISSSLAGAAVAAFVFFCRDIYGSFLDFVQADFAEKLRRMRISTVKLRTYLLAWSVVIVGGSGALWVAFDSFPLALLAAVVLFCGPWYLLRLMAQRYRDKIEDQLADGMASFSAAIRAGLSIPQSLELLAEQGPRPMRDEFRQIVGEYNLGKPLDRTMEEAKERLDSENFALFAAALMASRESGGKLNETVDRIATSVLEMQRLERKIRSETAQARRSALYMALAPLLILLVYAFVDPVNTARLFTTVPGQILLCVAIVLNLLAYFWARKILNPDI